MKHFGKHRKDCQARQAVRQRRRKTVWITPQLENEKVFYVCADPYCPVWLLVLDLMKTTLPAT